MSAKILSAGSYVFCPDCRDTSDVFETAGEARMWAKEHDKECFSND